MSPRSPQSRSAQPAGPVPDAEIIRRAQRGDAEAFEQLYQKYKGRVYSLCLRMLGNPTEAEDMAQEAFLQLFRKIATFRGESQFSTWLHRLAVNVVLMHLRRKQLPQVSLEEAIEPDEAGEGPKREPGVEDATLRGALDRVTLEDAIAKLPAGYRQVFLLHDVDGYEHNEIAQMLGCSVGNSKSQLHKARLRLRDLVQRARRKRGGQTPGPRLAS